MEIDYLFESPFANRGCYQIPVVGIPGAIGALTATTHGGGVAAGSAGSSNVGAGAGGGVAGYLAARGVGVNTGASGSTLTALDAQGALALGIPIGTTIGGGAAEYVLTHFIIPAAQPLPRPVPPPAAPPPPAPPPPPAATPSPLPVMHAQPIPISVHIAPPAPPPPPPTYHPNYRTFFSGGQMYEATPQEEAASQRQFLNLFNRIGFVPPRAPVITPPPPPPPPAPPPVFIAAPIPAALQEYEGAIQTVQGASDLITQGVQLVGQTGLNIGTAIGNTLTNLPASYLNYLSAQGGPNVSRETISAQPGGVAPMRGPLNAQLPKATAAFMQKTGQPGFVYGNYCPTCDPTVMPAIRAQCPDCTPDEIDQIVTQSVQGGDERDQLLLRAQQYQLQHSITTEQSQQTQQQVSQQQTQIARYRQTEQQQQTGQQTQTAQQIQQQIAQKQALLDQIAQELQDLESGQPSAVGSSQQPPAVTGPTVPQSSQYPITQSLTKPFQVATAREAAAAKQIAQAASNPSNAVQICFACESQQDAIAFMNGESSSCSLMSTKEI